MKVVILAGGKGTRLGLTDRPKPMVDVAGTPLLERLVRTAVRQGFREFLFLNGHLAEVIEAHFGDGSRFGAQITHVTESEPMGTAGAFSLVRDLLREPFVVMYGDILLDVDLRHMADFALAHGGLGSLLVHPNDHPYDSDLLAIDQDQRVVDFFPKPHEAGQVRENIVSAALYVLFPEALAQVPDGKFLDWGRDVFPSMVAQGLPLYGYRSIEYAKDVGTPERLTKAEKHLAEGRIERLSRARPKPAVFIDRDGVLNEEIDGVLRPQDMHVLPGAAEAVRRLNLAGLPAICVTNQPALAKGQMDWPALRQVHAVLDTELARQSGGFLDDLRICPHHPEAGWPGEVPALKVACHCRKPASGMLEDAAAFHGIDLTRSWIVGDRYADLQAGASVGACTILVLTGHAGHDRAKYPGLEPDHVCADLSAAVTHILQATP